MSELRVARKIRASLSLLIAIYWSCIYRALTGNREALKVIYCYYDISIVRYRR